MLVVKIINVIEATTGMSFPRFDGEGKLLMPESNSAKQAISMLDKTLIVKTVIQRFFDDKRFDHTAQ